MYLEVKNKDGHNIFECRSVCFIGDEKLFLARMVIDSETVLTVEIEDKATTISTSGCTLRVVYKPVSSFHPRELAKKTYERCPF